VAEPGGDHVDGDSCEEQRGRVQVAQIMEPGVGQRLGRGSDRLVVPVDQLGHECGHSIRIERFTPPACVVYGAMASLHRGEDFLHYQSRARLRRAGPSGPSRVRTRDRDSLEAARELTPKLSQ
jgi:hypothetical protein